MANIPEEWIATLKGIYDFCIIKGNKNMGWSLAEWDSHSREDQDSIFQTLKDMKDAGLITYVYDKTYRPLSLGLTAAGIRLAERL